MAGKWREAPERHHAWRGVAAVRFGAAFLCFHLVFSAAGATDLSPSSPTDTYIKTRDGYIADFRAHPAAGASDKRMDRALGDLESRLNAVIPTWHAPGFPPEGKINLNGMDDNEIGLSVLNGLDYHAGDTDVVVTTAELLRHWIADHNRWWRGSDAIPLPLGKALRSEPFWTYALDTDSGAFLFGEIPVGLHGGTGVVLLAVRTQTGILETGPEYLFAAVLRGDRAFVASQKLLARIPKEPECQHRLRQASFDRDAVKRADRDFRACFAPYLHQQPQYESIVRQAQSLVDLLH